MAQDRPSPAPPANAPDDPPATLASDQDALVDEASEESFPASDPPSFAARPS